MTLKKKILGFVLDCLLGFRIVSYRLKYLIKKENKKINICISTTKGYSEKTIPLLLDDLLENGFAYESIYVFEGGYNYNKKINEKYNHYHVDHNSFDLTALISLIELKNDLGESDFWLLLHDTVRLTKNFKYLFNSLNTKNYDCLPLRNFPSMNIGVYSINYLAKNSNYLIQFKNQNYSVVGLQNCKLKAIHEEDYLFKNTTNRININSDMERFEKSKNITYFGKRRKEEFYPQLGILKYKANYKFSEVWSIDL